MLRRLIVFIAVLWLPLQSWAVVAMPFCAHGSHGPVAGRAVDCHAAQTPGDHGAAAHDQHGGHAQHDRHAPAPDQPGDAPQVSQGCDDCGFCHLACAGMMPLADARHAVPDLSAVRNPPALAAAPAVFLQHPYRPPLSAAL